MEKLNNKIKNGKSELINDAQMVGIYGYDSTEDQLRRLACDNEGKLKTEISAEIKAEGLALESKQDTMINATVRDINNTTAIGDGSSQATALSLGYDRTGGQGRAILVDSGGKVEVNASMNTGHGLATEAKQDDLINATNRAINNTGSIGDGSTNATSVALGYDRTGGKGRAVLVNGAGELMVNLGSSTTQNVDCFGAETNGTQQQLLVSSNGTLQTQDSEVFGKTAQIANQTTLSNTNEATIIANQTNGTQKAIVGNTVGDGSGDAKFLLCDAQGHLQVDILSGGGGGSTPTTTATVLTTTSTVIGTSSTVSFITGLTGFTQFNVDGVRDLTYIIEGSGTNPSLTITEMVGATAGVLAENNFMVGAFSSVANFACSSTISAQHRGLKIKNNSSSDTFTVSKITAIFVR